MAASVSNISNEDRFARQNCANAACHGRVPQMSTVASRHVLTELQTLHHCKREESVIPASTAMARENCGCGFRSAWHAFVATTALGDLKTKGARWQALSAQERLKYAELTAGRTSTGAREVRDEPAPMVPTPFNIGDCAYPVSKAFASVVAENVREAHDKWVNMVGGCMGIDRNLALHDSTGECCAAYGEGRCVRTSAERWKHFLQTLIFQTESEE